jgi:hypothetical protein
MTSFEKTMIDIENATEGYLELKNNGEWEYHYSKESLPDNEDHSLICERPVFMASIGEFSPTEISQDEAIAIMKM